MSRHARLSVALIALMLAGCTRLVDVPQARPAPAIGPVTAAQVHDLLSPKVESVEGNQFDVVVPERCRAVAREVAAPFLTDHGPAAIDGGH